MAWGKELGTHPTTSVTMCSHCPCTIAACPSAQSPLACIFDFGLILTSITAFSRHNRRLPFGAVAACMYLPLRPHPDEHYSVQSVWHNRRLPFGTVAAGMYVPLQPYPDSHCCVQCVLHNLHLPFVAVAACMHVA